MRSDARKCPLSKCFSKLSLFWVISPKTATLSPPVRKSQTRSNNVETVGDRQKHVNVTWIGSQGRPLRIGQYELPQHNNCPLHSQHTIPPNYHSYTVTPALLSIFVNALPSFRFGIKAICERNMNFGLECRIRVFEWSSIWNTRWLFVNIAEI